MKKLCILLAALIAAAAVLCSCSGGSESAAQKSAKPLAEVFKTIRSQVEISDFNEYNNVKSLDRFYGITAEQTEDFAGGINSSGTDQEEIVFIKAKDSACAEEIKKAFDDRYKSKLAQTKNYNAKQAEMVEKCKPERFDLYVTLIVSPNADKITEIFKSELNLE